MFDLPSVAIDEVERFADWVELCALCSEDPVVSVELVSDVVKDAGLLGHEEGDVPSNDDPYADKDLDFSSEDQLGAFTDQVWEELQRRRRHGGYPFLVAEKTIRRMADSWTESPGFAKLLVWDIGGQYDTVCRSDLSSDGISGRLFEHVVTAACHSLFGGPCTRFGWPRDDSRPSDINGRIRQMADELELEVQDLEGETEPTDKDISLDVVSLIEVAGGHLALPRFLVQCAVGSNWWSEKTGDPKDELWRDLIKWQGPLIRAIAIPWRLEARRNYQRSYRHFNHAVILDRPRLVAGMPDRHLPSDIAESLVRWCQPLIDQLPRL